LTEGSEKLGSIVKLGGSMPFQLSILLDSTVCGRMWVIVFGEPPFEVAFDHG
jgi:hypothetical protein